MGRPAKSSKRNGKARNRCARRIGKAKRSKVHARRGATIGTGTGQVGMPSSKPGHAASAPSTVEVSPAAQPTLMEGVEHGKGGGRGPASQDWVPKVNHSVLLLIGTNMQTGRPCRVYIRPGKWLQLVEDLN